MTGDPALPPGYILAAHDEIDSTNAEAARCAAAGAPSGLVVWALLQTHGRGRRATAWETPRGNLACSILLRPDAGPGEAAQLGFAAALAAADLAAAAVPHRAVRVKWPNDVLVDERKLSGVLLEAVAGPDGGLVHLIVGIGINLVRHPEGTETPATDLLAAGGPAMPPGEALERLLAGFERRFADWRQRGFAALRQPWLARAWALGDTIRVRLDHETLEGRFAGIDAAGVLVLEMANGLKRHVAAGQVFPAAAPGGADAARRRRG